MTIPYEFVCYACGYRVITPTRNAGYIEMIKHYHSSHSNTFNNVVFDDDDNEFVSLEFHKKRKELIIFVNKIRWNEYKELKFIHSIKPLPKTKIL